MLSGWPASRLRVLQEQLLAVSVVESYMAHHHKAGQAAVFLLAPTGALDQVDYHLRGRSLRSTVRNR